jgi:hypothetical protein
MRKWRVASAKKEKRDFSLRHLTASQERGGKKNRRVAPLEMTGLGIGMGKRRGHDFAG